jgi:N-acetylmuramoyl-L-alanine amidase
MSFDSFVAALSGAKVEFEHLKVAQLAQAMLESGRGTSALFTQHNNPYGMKYRSEMAGLATSVSYTDSAGETDHYCRFASDADAVRGYWRFIDRSPYSGWRAAAASPLEYLRFITFAGYLGGPHDQVPPAQRAADRKKKTDYIAKLQKLFPEAEKRLRDAHAAQVPPGADAIWRHKGVFLDVGHGQKPEGYDPGAINAGSNITEHALNLTAAAACAAALRAVGVPVLIDDGKKDNYTAGKASAGYDVFVSLHHNSSENPAQGTEVFSHVTKGTAADRALATQASAAIATELGITDRGGKAASFSVLSGARDAKVRAAILAEFYFIHRQTPPNPPPASFHEWSRRGGEALAGAIIAWLRANP